MRSILSELFKMTEDPKGRDETSPLKVTGQEKRKSRSKQQTTRSSEDDEEGAPPRKAIKLEDEENQGVDAVEFARKALEMYKQEVQGDGDFEEPDTTPATAEKTDESGSKSNSKNNAPTVEEEEQEEEEVITATTRWQKVGRQPMISDDPSIL